MKKLLDSQSFYAIGEFFVAFDSQEPFSFIVDAERGAEKHQFRKSLAMAKSKMQRHATAKGVAPEHERLLGKDLGE
jgi:hypothetical protein